ncbi:MAG: 3-methyl-2-oxobutanoate hydroxymethyltransferase [Acidobacteria bacterium]|nr:MAG: 3-methyl-2-oxobutanoate hydroxymethyltransferase [Acidobacteriota bacterium]
MSRKTIPQITAETEKKLVMLTAYDYWTSQLVDQAGTDMILVGDSLGMVIQGNEHTLGVSVEDIIYHTRAVVKGRQNALVVSDMPYMSYHISEQETIQYAGRIIREGGADAVKLEGGKKRVSMIQALLDAEIPVMGHLGLTPQSVNKLGGFKVQGKAPKDRQELKADALALQEAGVFALVLECVPFDLAREITETVDIPTIGIGAGPYCTGQVLVIHDLLGMSFGFKPKFVRPYANFSETGLNAVESFCKAVREGEFPTLAESFGKRTKSNKTTLLYAQK